MKLLNRKTGWLVLIALLPVLAKAQEEKPLEISLEKAVEIALSENPTVKVADREIEKKKYAQKGSYAPLFPQINLTADYNRTLKKQVMYMDNAFEIDIPGVELPPSDPNKGIEVGRNNNWSGGVNFSMPLIAPTLWKSLEISAIDVELAIESARSSKISMVNQVKRSFYGVLLAQDSYNVFKTSYDNAVMNYNDVNEKYTQGTVAEYDLIRADVQVKNIEPSMLQAENALALALWQLKALLGMNLEIPISCTGSLTNYEQEMYADYMSTDTSLVNNSDLKQIGIQTRQLSKTLQMQKFEYLPTLSFSGLYQFTSMNNDFKFNTYKWNPYSMVGVSLSIPIFSGGQRKYKVAQTRVSLEQIRLQHQDLERNLQLAVKQYMDNMKTCVKQFNASQKAVKQAEKGYMISQKRYETGMATLLELNDADLALTQARLTFNQSIYNYVVAKSDLEKTLGEQK